MVEMEQSNYEISLRYPYLSDLTVPAQASLMSINATTINDNQCSPVSISTEASSTCATGLLASTAKVSSCKPIRTASFGKLVACSYKPAGCTEILAHGTAAEIEHHKSCQYRPIPCLMQHVCKQLVPYHNFLLHHMQHFIYPTFSRIFNTSVVFEREDFDCNQRWQPRWINCYEKDFFLMISHKIPGMWYFWVWMMGSPEEAKEFSYDIEIAKRTNRKMGTFPALSFRTSEDELEKHEICLSMTDYQVKRISQIKENLVGSFDIDLMIHKSSSSSVNRFWLREK